MREEQARNRQAQREALDMRDGQGERKQRAERERSGEQGRRAGQSSSIYGLFVLVVLGSSLGNLSQTAVNAMLGDIMLEFGMDVGLGQWLTTSYMLMLGITVPVATYLSRRFSPRQHLFIGLAFFLLGALLDLLAPNFGIMLVGRVCQAVSAGILLPLMQTIAMTGFPAGRQATAMGVAGIAMGFAPNIGPTIGGAMSFAWGWRSYFVLLVAITVVLGAVAAFVIKPSDAPDGNARLDVTSLLLSTVGFGGVLLAFSNASSFSFESPFIWAPLVLGVAFLVLFVRRQNRSDNPLISMKIFESAQYRAGFVAQNLLNASFMGITLILPLYVENLCGGTALDAGIALLPGTVAALVLNPVAGILTDCIGVRAVALVSGAFLTVGSASMMFLEADTPLAVVMLCQGLRACGVSGLIGPLTSWSLMKLPRPLVADGSSFGIVVRQACASFGTSVMIFAVTVVGASSLGLADPALAYQVAFGISAVLAAATLAFIVVKVR